VVPRDAVNDGPDGTYVYVVSGGKAVVHPVKVLFDDSQNIAVDSDIKPGDPVIVEGQLRVDPGSSVRVMDGGAPQSGPPRKGGGNGKMRKAPAGGAG
jgi:multidrug efflux pump subunit AcrA (membrane-fusion protein)